MQDDILTVKKFCTCFALDIDFFKDNPVSAGDVSNLSFNVDDFSRMMVKNDMDHYTELLLHYVAIIDFKEMDLAIRDLYTNWLRQYEFKKELAELMLFLLTPDKPEISSIKIEHARDSYTVKNKAIINSMIDFIYVFFNSNDYSKVEQSNGGERVEISRENVEKYLASVNKMIEVSRGAQFKNFLPTQIGLYLSFLKRIDRFILINQEVNDFNNINLTNKDCRFVYDCLLTFGLIEEQNSTQKTTTPEKYTRALLSPERFESMEKFRKESGAYLLYNQSIYNTIDSLNNLRQDIQSSESV